jgi:predicted glutamine amidotransferase
MCDLFALSATKDYSAPEFLPVFAVQAKQNMDGWGIGYFRKHHAFVEKSAERIFHSGQLHDSFQRLARVVKSRIIICHLRFQTSGPVDECHAHPFVLKFGGHDWIFAHNGKAPDIESYRTCGIAIEDTVSDSAKAFEYLRDRMEDYHRHDSKPDQLFKALMNGTSKMIDQYPGEYNFLMSNGHLLFAFTNHRQFMLMKGSNKLKGAFLLTTLPRGLTQEKWLRVAKATNRRGLLLAISGNDVILHQSI